LEPEKDPDSSSNFLSGVRMSVDLIQWKYLILMGIVSISYYLAWWTFMTGVGPVLQSVIKAVMYVSIILWSNCAYYLSQWARGEEVESFEFQVKQIKMTLWILGVLILIEIPIWLDALL
jgi:hypothetical protein